MVTPVLFDYWRSSASYRVRLALALKDIAYTRVPVNLAQGEHKGADHLARNPMGTVPVLEIDGLRLHQSLAMIEYLDETRPGIALLPANPADRAKVRALALLVAADIHPLGNLGTLKQVAALGGETAKLDWVRRHIERGLQAYEATLAKAAAAPFSCGDTPTLADLCLIPQLYNADRWGANLKPMPRVREIRKAFAKLPAYDMAHPDGVNANG